MSDINTTLNDLDAGIFMQKTGKALHDTALELTCGDTTENLVHGKRGTTTKHYIRQRKWCR